jgi:Double zinc ribbon
MDLATSCPRCKHRLRVATGIDSRWVTCPRCLASVGNPHLLEAVVAMDDSTVTGTTYELAPDERKCPACGRSVEPGWRRCPHCEEYLRFERRRVRRRPRAADEDVRRDSRGANAGFLVLGGLVVAGAILFFIFFQGLDLALSSKQPQNIVGFCLIVLAIFLGGLVAIAVGSSSTAIRIVTGVLGGLTVGATLVCLVIFVFCVGIVSTCGLIAK